MAPSSRGPNPVLITDFESSALAEKGRSKPATFCKHLLQFKNQPRSIQSTAFFLTR